MLMNFKIESDDWEGSFSDTCGCPIHRCVTRTLGLEKNQVIVSDLAVFIRPKDKDKYEHVKFPDIYVSGKVIARKKLKNPKTLDLILDIPDQLLQELKNGVPNHN